MPTINVNISTGADDGFLSFKTKTTKGYRNYTATDLIISAFISGSRDYAALRFKNINIPQGSTINSATLKLIKKSIFGAPAGKIWGNNIDNAPAWGTTNLVRNISKTAHSASLNTSVSTSSNNVTAIVQDIVNRGGWLANNSMAFRLSNTAASGSWRCYAYEKGGADIPNLSVTYSSGGGTPTVGFSGIGGRTGTTGQVGFAG